MKSNQIFFNLLLYQLPGHAIFFELVFSVIDYFNINGLHIFWESFEWFCLQICRGTKYIFPLLSKALGSRINSCFVIFAEEFFYIIIFVGYILSFGLVWLRTIRLSSQVGAHIERRCSRSRGEDGTITDVIIKTPDRKYDWGCEWRHVRKR